jgi:Na+/H+-translocating membrane pyrophosphatase
MKKGYRVAMIIGILGFPCICYKFLNYKGSWFAFSICGWIGVGISYFFIEITRYYTDYNYAPVRKIVNASKHGPATNIIAGISVGLESTALPIIVIVVGLLMSYKLGEMSGIKDMKGNLIGGLFGTAVSTMGMFSTGVFILSMSGFGPIADNAGGIVEMSH